MRPTPRLFEILVQALLLGLVAGGVLFALQTARARMAAQGIPFSFAFLFQEAGFSLSEGVTYAPGEGFRPYHPGDAYWQAFLTGFLNTLRVALAGLFLATFLGFAVGVGRLSQNPLVRGLALLYVELIRNTPLLLQLFVWYFAVLLKLPPVEQALRLWGAWLSQRGLFLPWLEATPALPAFLALLALLGGVFWFGTRRGRLGARWRFGLLGLFALLALLLWPPFHLDLPARTPFGVRGGLEISPEFAALLFGLSVYTAAFIAEVVRGAILAVPKGQWEAALALGLTPRQVLRQVVLPQAVRIALPPLINQYLNLTKNSSLAVAVAYPDLFSVYNTVANQSGRALEGILIVMGVYLSISLTISALVNAYNRKVVLRWGL
ncbi:MAG: amino acid ABC transporter permease [Thermus sp.]